MQVCKLTLLALKAVPIFEGVVVPLASAQVADGVFMPNPAQEAAAKAVVDQLVRWDSVLLNSAVDQR